MILKTHKDVYKQVATKLELPYEMVELVGNFTWDKLGKSLENFENRVTYLYALGEFRFRKKRSLEYIQKVENIKELMLKMGRPIEQAELAEERTKKKVEKLNVLIKAWDERMLEKEQFKIRKKEYYVNRDIQEQSSNLGGTKESNI